MQPEEIGKIVKEKFIALVEQRFLQRVRPPNLELTTLSHGEEKMGGVVSAVLHDRFQLPPSVESEQHTYPKPFPNSKVYLFTLTVCVRGVPQALTVWLESVKEQASKIVKNQRLKDQKSTNSLWCSCIHACNE